MSRRFSIFCVYILVSGCSCYLWSTGPSVSADEIVELMDRKVEEPPMSKKSDAKTRDSSGTIMGDVSEQVSNAVKCVWDAIESVDEQETGITVADVISPDMYGSGIIKEVAGNWNIKKISIEVVILSVYVILLLKIWSYVLNTIPTIRFVTSLACYVICSMESFYQMSTEDREKLVAGILLAVIIMDILLLARPQDALNPFGHGSTIPVLLILIFKLPEASSIRNRVRGIFSKCSPEMTLGEWIGRIIATSHDLLYKTLSLGFNYVAVMFRRNRGSHGEESRDDEKEPPNIASPVQTFR